MLEPRTTRLTHGGGHERTVRTLVIHILMDGREGAIPERGDKMAKVDRETVSLHELTVSDSTKLQAVQVALIAAYSLIILLGVFGNSMVIYLVLRHRYMRTVTNLFIANLALADLLVNTLCLPFTLAYTLRDTWTLGAVMCHGIPFAQALAVNVSTLTLTVIALDRHRCIVYHAQSRCSMGHSRVLIGCTWLLAAILAAPLAIFREYRVLNIPGLKTLIPVCSEKWPSEAEHNGTVYSVCMLLLQYVLPLAIITVAYLRIWHMLRGAASPGGSEARRCERQRRRRKAMRMLATVVVLFAVCWLPLHAFQLASDLDNRLLRFAEYKLLYTAFHIIAMCSTFVNPFLYGWMNTNYRNGFLHMWTCWGKPHSIRPEPELGSAHSHSIHSTLHLQDLHSGTAAPTCETPYQPGNDKPKEVSIRGKHEESSPVDEQDLSPFSSRV
uniref:Neuropeptide Y receptor type 2 n=1 Tax=Eptatretus burgeri TaxID=7764 RepID=A0A8C4Q5W2_EPTBU